MRRLWSRKLTALLLAALMIVPSNTVWAEDLFSDAAGESSQETVDTQELQDTQEVFGEETQAQQPESFQAEDSEGIQVFSQPEQENTWISMEYENPLYGGTGQVQYVETDSPPMAYYQRASVPYFSSTQAAIEYFRTSMVNRERAINIQITCAWDQVSSVAMSIFKGAIEDTGNLQPIEGDYLKFQYGNFHCTAKKSGTKAYLYYEMLYYTTAAQEQAVTQKVNQALAQMNLGAKSYADKIRTIYDYVCANVQYDRNNYVRIDPKEVESGTRSYEEFLAERGRYTAYNALIKGSAVCQGYANLLYRFLKESGIDNRIVSGTGNGIAHAWNIIRMEDGFYYNCDSTWDAGKMVYSYYMKDMENFPGHIRDEDYTTAAFMNRYPTPESFPADRIALTQTVFAYTGSAIKPKVSVSGLTLGTDYEVSYEENIEPGIMTILVKGKGRFYGEGSITAKIVDIPKIRTVSGLKQKSQSTDQVTLTWNKVPDATNYQVYLYSTSAKKFFCKATVTGNTYTLSGNGVHPGKQYRFKIRAYYRETLTYEGTSKVFTSLADFSNEVTVVTRPKVPTVKSLTTSAKAVTIKWNRFSACTGYQIQISTSSKFTAGTTQNYNMPKNTYTGRKMTKLKNKALKTKTRYYVRMRAYIKSPSTGTNYYGSWSNVKNIVCK